MSSGTAISQSEPAATGSEVLPNLSVLAPQGVEVERHVDRRGRSHWWLVFFSEVWNAGPGAFELKAQNPASRNRISATQVVFTADGGSVSYPQVAQMQFAGLGGHGHWHTKRLVVFELRSADGSRLVARDRKVGYCPADTDFVASGRPGFSEKRRYRDCGELADRHVTVGFSPGWGDLYPPIVSGQFIDITHLPRVNRAYTLQHRVNSTGRLHETTRTDNAAWALIDLSWRAGVPRVTTQSIWEPPIATSLSRLSPSRSGRANGRRR